MNHFPAIKLSSAKGLAKGHIMRNVRNLL